MLKVLAVNDKPGSAIDRLAQGLKPFHTNIDYQVVSVHPKKPSEEQLNSFAAAAAKADIIVWDYWKTAEMLRAGTTFAHGQKQILCHYNPYSIAESDWNGYDLVIGCNESIYKALGEITLAPTDHVPLTVDTDFWTHRPPEMQPKEQVLMVANRIESKKGILEVAKACKELGVDFVLVGNISKADYFHEVIRTGNVKFFENISDEDLRQLYWDSKYHVCNSVDNFESGTLPVIEAMLCGSLVISRPVGHVPELDNGENMIISKESPEGVQTALKQALDLSEDDWKEMVSKASNTAKSRSNERRAYMLQKLYRQVMWSDEVSVSVVVPVFDNPEIITQCVDAIRNQTHKNIEVIVVSDSLDFPAFDRQESKQPFRLIDNFKNDYGLARARNIGAIEATGEILVFCDQRQIMEPDAVAEFVKFTKPNYWLYGVKDGAKKDFVENFSSIRRDDFFKFGMFCERMEWYGGLSEETRVRARRQGMTIERVESAKAHQAGKSRNRAKKRPEIIKSKNRLFKMGYQ